MRDGTLLGTEMLMFIGGGSAGTAGGIKVTTFILLFFVILAEVRGEKHVNAGRRQDRRARHRQALTVALLSIGTIAVATLVLLELTDVPTDQVLFEAVSAFATVGLSTGITADLPRWTPGLLVVLMFIGPAGPITLVSALALRERQLRYTAPGRKATHWLGSRHPDSSPVVVVGLGRFGKSLAPRARRRKVSRSSASTPTRRWCSPSPGGSPTRRGRHDRPGGHAAALGRGVRPRGHRRSATNLEASILSASVLLNCGVRTRLGQGHQPSPTPGS